MSTAAAKRDAYVLLASQARSIFEHERDALANYAQFAALIFNSLPGVNWAGFYIARGQELVLGPFQGKLACVRIPLHRGVCGAAARSRSIQVVADVHAVPDHIACDPNSRSELVVPFLVEGVLAGVFDIDSPIPGRFDATDAAGVEELLGIVIGSSERLV